MNLTAAPSHALASLKSEIDQVPGMASLASLSVTSGAAAVPGDHQLPSALENILETADFCWNLTLPLSPSDATQVGSQTGNDVVSFTLTSGALAYIYILEVLIFKLRLL